MFILADLVRCVVSPQIGVMVFHVGSAMNTSVSFSNECKFAFLGLTNARVDIPAAGITFADGMEVLTKPPIDLDSEWQNWLGIQASQVSAANLVFARRAVDGFLPASLPISDDTSWNLAKQVENVFSMLRLLGTIEYESGGAL